MLITGAGGFIGSHLAERLVALGARTKAFVHYNSNGTWGWLEGSRVRDEIEFVAGDIRDLDGVKPAFSGIDVVFHLAALIGIPYSYYSPLAYVRTNVEGTLNVLQATRDCSVSRLVHTSTSEAYGTACYVPMDENHPLQGQSPYSASKIGADKLAESFQRSFDVPVSTIRPFNTYGPRQSARAITPTIITQALTGSELRLGNLSPTRDLTYVADTVEGFVRIADCPQAVGEVVNIGSGREISVGGLATAVMQLVGKDIPIVVDDSRVRADNSEVQRLYADNRRARDLLAWEPQRSLEDGLAATIEWVGEHQEAYHKGVYAV